MNYQKDRKNTNGDEKMSRRNFLKCTGTIIFVVGAGCFVPAKKGYSNVINEMKIEVQSRLPRDISLLISESARVVLAVCSPALWYTKAWRIPHCQEYR